MKGDIISMQLDASSKKVIFKKKAESFEIPYSTIEGDDLYPCALFYYMND